MGVVEGGGESGKDKTSDRQPLRVNIQQCACVLRDGSAHTILREKLQIKTYYPTSRSILTPDQPVPNTNPHNAKRLSG